MTTDRVSLVHSALLLLAVSAMAQAPVKPLPIPPGFDFPADKAGLLSMVEKNDQHGLRMHAWMVFAGMTQPAPTGEAIWETWYSGDETFGSGVSPQAVRKVQRRFRTPRQFEKSGLHAEAVGESLLSFTLFDQSARDHIRKLDLYKASTLDKINASFGQNTPISARSINDFPVDAVALKTVWWVVKAIKATVIPIWDGVPGNPGGSNSARTWKRCVAVDSSGNSPGGGQTAKLSCNGVTTDCHLVPVTSFYSFRISAENLQTIRASNAGNANTAELGDYVVLLAMHMTTKEIPDWVWASFWWHDKPGQGPFAADRPVPVRGVWRNYLMTTSYSMVAPTESDGSPHASFNPWLEAGFPNGTLSNCMNCHRQARWQKPSASFLPIRRGELSAEDPMFGGGTKVDFLWSVALEPLSH